MATKPVFNDGDPGAEIRRKLNELGDYFEEVNTPEVQAVAANIADVKKVADIDADIDAVAANIPAIIAAPTHASAAANSASQALAHRNDAAASAGAAAAIVWDGATGLPKLRPTLNLDFANGRYMDPRVSFTRASTATYFDAMGVLRTSAPGEPRFDYDPVTGESLGLLVEGQVTNLMVPSDHPKGTPFGLSISGDSIYIGDITLALFIEDGSNGTHLTNSPNINRVAGTTYTESFYAKSSGRQVYVFSSSSVWGGTTSARFNLDSGIVEATVNATAKMEYIGGGVWRCQFTVTAVSNGSTSWRYYLHNGSSFNYQGDALSGVYMGGIQSEVGTSPTSYIKTEASQITRAADDVVIPTSEFPFNPDEGTLVVEGSAKPRGAAIDANRATLAKLGNAVGGLEGLVAQFNGGTGNFEVSSRKSGDPAIELSLGPANGVVRIALSYKGSSLKASMNGGPVVAGTNTFNGAATTLFIGAGGLAAANAANRRANAPIRTITYFPRALSDAELQALTS